MLRRRARLCLLCLCGVAWLSVVGPVRAASPFGGSTLTLTSPPPAEGGAFTYTLVLRNAGGTEGGSLEIHLPRAEMFVRIEGLEGATVDRENRTVRWEGSVARGTSLTGTVSLVAGLDSGGQITQLNATARPWQGEPTYLVQSAAIDTVPSPSAFRVGRFGVTAAGVAVLGWMAASIVFWIALRVIRPRSAAWAAVAIMVPVGFLLYFAALAREDARILALPQTTCTVLDRVLDTRTAASSSASSSRLRTVHAPRLALAYREGDHARIAQGFGTDSGLSNASAARAEALLGRYAIGARVPCAIDTSDPRRAYVEAGFGGAYVFALIPLPLLVLGVWGLSSELRRRR